MRPALVRLPATGRVEVDASAVEVDLSPSQGQERLLTLARVQAHENEQWKVKPNLRLSARGPEERGRFLPGEPTVLRFRPFGKVDGHDTGQPSFAVRMVDGGSKHAKLAPHRPGGASANPVKGSAGLARDVGDRAAFPEGCQALDRISDAPLRGSRVGALGRLVGENVCHEDLRWVTGAI